MNFQDVLDKCRAHEEQARKGKLFEHYMRRFLKTYQITEPDIECVYMWDDFSKEKGINENDMGIDLVALTKAGEYWAIQCKIYADKLDYGNIKSFLAADGRDFKDTDGRIIRFSKSILITTAELNQTAYNATRSRRVPLYIMDFHELEIAQVSWDKIVNGEEGKGARKEPFELLPHQKLAFDKAMEHYKTNDRGRMIMACGTGKTFTSLKIAEAVVERERERERERTEAASCSLPHPYLWSVRHSMRGYLKQAVN